MFANRHTQREDCTSLSAGKLSSRNFALTRVFIKPVLFIGIPPQTPLERLGIRSDCLLILGVKCDLTFTQFADVIFCGGDD